ncbi:MAG: hypothetical protein HQK89_11050 [Nitrospirae bacterium]|nr:hypothetical protein [Nitrospirota bacterium]
MSILKTISPEEATGKVAEIYSTFKGMLGTVPQAIQLYSVSPAMMESHFSNIGYYMKHPSLNMALLAFIRMLISVEGNCKYCVDFNKGMLMQGGLNAEVLDASIKDPQNAPLPEKEKALLLFVLKAAKNPHSVEVADVEALRKLGWSDSDIFDATHHGANMVAGDIMLDAFKVGKD